MRKGDTIAQYEVSSSTIRITYVRLIQIYIFILTDWHKCTQTYVFS